MEEVDSGTPWIEGRRVAESIAGGDLSPSVG